MNQQIRLSLLVQGIFREQNFSSTVAGILSYQMQAQGFKPRESSVPSATRRAGRLSRRGRTPCGARLGLNSSYTHFLAVGGTNGKSRRRVTALVIFSSGQSAQACTRSARAPSPARTHRPARSSPAQPSPARSGSGSGAERGRLCPRHRPQAGPGAAVRRAVFWEAGLARIPLDLRWGLPKWCVPARREGCWEGVCPAR